jgi:protein YibB
MNDITIVTAFFDIGRGEWSPDKGLPAYLQRTTETYMERFGYMAKLENDMVVFTSKEFVDDIKSLRQDRPTNILTIDFPNSFEKLREEITKIQSDPRYQAKINPFQVRNPEYWNADYVLVNLLKSSFVNQAINRGIIDTDLIAWMDFGYCRDPNTTNDINHWYCPLDKDKIHFFTIKDWVDGTYIEDVIINNDVHVTGPCIVAGKEKWPILEALVHHNVNELIKNNLMDDDQTLLLMSYLQSPESFELHRLNGDWFVAFKEYHVNPD